MSNLIKVDEVYFDTRTEQPVLKLEDGSTRVVYLVPTGNCWMEYWVTPEYLNKAEKDARERDKENQKKAMERLEAESKKRWWQS